MMARYVLKYLVQIYLNADKLPMLSIRYLTTYLTNQTVELCKLEFCINLVASGYFDIAIPEQKLV